ncbi:MAG: DNA-binding protein [Gammaproteobacteria bacterium]|nr:DNA-binding protein [Gammaproteobacteria bacterium]
MRKRFIAGAKCKGCRAEDTTYVIYGEGEETLHCVKCDFSEKKENEVVKSIVQEWTPIKLRDID